MDQMQDSRHLIEVRKAGDKGLGMFAIADIPCGTRVIAETAALRFDRREAKKHGSTRTIWNAFDNLPESIQKEYLELHSFESEAVKRNTELELKKTWSEIPDHRRKVLAIFATNSFGHIFLLGSRMNHSCLPNICFTYNPALDKQTFHAVRDIKKGEELTVSYIDTFNRTRDQRQADLKPWGFECVCPVCENTEEGIEKEKKRAELFNLDQERIANSKLNTSSGWEEYRRLSEEIAVIQKSEGMLTRGLGVSYHEAAMACVWLGRATDALLWAEEELEVDRYCVGEDHPDFEFEKEVVQHLEATVETSSRITKRVADWFLRKDLSGFVD